MYSLLCSFFFLLIHFFSFNCFIILRSDRNIDLTTQLCKENVIYSVQKQASDSSDFVIPIDGGNIVHASFFINDKIVSYVNKSLNGIFSFLINVKSVKVGENFSLKSKFVIANALQPFPSTISQLEDQLVKYSTNLYVYSAYEIKEQQTILSLYSDSIESYTKVNPYQLKGKKLILGPYSEQKAFSKFNFNIHFLCNAPFLTITNLDRNIIVSHWGTIFIEETIDVFHSGAKLVGPFSRFDYQMQSARDTPSVDSFVTSLPASAYGVYYRDEIGNISTSALRERHDRVEVFTRPRFPLFGGWKAHYTLGYSVPVYEYVYRSGNNYRLQMSMLDHVFSNMYVDRLNVRVTLPERVSHITLNTPYQVQRQPDELVKTYLDFGGRPVLTFSAQNLVENHIQDFEISYQFNMWCLLCDLMLPVVACFIVLLLVVCLVRVNFSLGDEAEQNCRDKICAIGEQVRTHLDAVTAVHDQFEALLQRYKLNKDSGKLNSQLAAADKSIRLETAAIGECVSRLKSQGAHDMATRIGRVLEINKQIRALYAEHVKAVEKLIASKIGRTAYLDLEEKLKASCVEKCQARDDLISGMFQD